MNKKLSKALITRIKFLEMEDSIRASKITIYLFCKKTEIEKTEKREITEFKNIYLLFNNFKIS